MFALRCHAVHSFHPSPCRRRSFLIVYLLLSHVDGGGRVTGITRLIPSPLCRPVLDQELACTSLRIFIGVKDPEADSCDESDEDEEEHGPDLSGMNISTPIVAVVAGLFALFGG